MKKYIVILLLFLFTTSCNKYISKNIYERTYNEEDVAMVDVYTHLYYYDVDSLYLHLWMVNDLTTDTISIRQHTIQKIITDMSRYQFVLSKYTYPTSLYWTFLIRYSGYKKDMQKGPVKPLPE
jgi:hypothetical protein